MKPIMNNAIFLLIPLIMVIHGCESPSSQYDFSTYEKVYMPQATEMPAERPVLVVDTLQHIDYNAAYAGANTPNRDIHVNFTVNTALVDSFNANNFTSYSILPKESYELSKTEATIPAGQRGTEKFKLALQTEGYIKAGGTRYLLPISINVKEQDVPLNNDLKTTYFLIEGSYLEIDKSNWQVIDFDSQQPGRDDLAASNIIDGDDGTIWNTQYTDPRPAPPHYVTIDMGDTYNVHGFTIVGRNKWLISNPKEITLEFSDNGEDWRDAESFTLAMNDDDVITDKIYLSNTVTCRYFKFTVDQNVKKSQEVTNVAELYAF